MLTFEKVLDIFKDYLVQDLEVEVYKSRYGYVGVDFVSLSTPMICEAHAFKTPEELFDYLLAEYRTFTSIQLTDGAREITEEDREQIKCLCQKYIDLRDEAMK